MADKELRETLDYCMLHEHDLVKAIYEKKNDRGNRSGGRKTGISRPTENQALWLIASVGPVLVNDYFLVEEPERTLNAIRYTKAHYNVQDKYGIIYKARYIDGETWQDTCDAMHLASSTYYDRVNTIIGYAADVWERIKC